MRDASPRTSSSALTLGEISELLGGRLSGPPDARVRAVAPIDQAGPEEMAFLALPRYARFASTSRAGAFLVGADVEDSLPSAAPRVVVEDAYGALRVLLERLFPESPQEPEVHPSVALGRDVRLGRGVRIDAYAVLGERVSIGDGVRIGAHCVLGDDTSVGEGSVLHPHVVTYPRTAIGARCVLHAGVRVGCDGFGYTTRGGTHLKMPQVGRAVIGNDVEIGANTTIDRGSLGDTVLDDQVKIDNLVQVAHNVRVGAGSMLAALVGIAGSTRIGRGVWLGGRASAVNHLEIGDGARVTFGSTLTRDVAPGETVSGYPAREHREELRRQATLGRVAKLVTRVRSLEQALRGGTPPEDRDASRETVG